MAVWLTKLLKGLGIGIQRTGFGTVAFGASFIRSWRLVIAFIIIFATLTQGAIDSYNERSPVPFLYQTGGRVVASDQLIWDRYVEMRDNNYIVPIEFNPPENTQTSFISKIRYMTLYLKAQARFLFAWIMFFFDILSSLWFIYYFWRFWYWIFLPINDSLKYKAFFRSFLVVVAFQSAFGIISYFKLVAGQPMPMDWIEGVKTFLIYLVPFKGMTWGLGSIIYHLIQPAVYNNMVEPINLTNP